jgi:tyrosine-protein kinase Etk/Wzc
MAAQFQPSRSDQAGFNVKEFFFKYLRFLPLFILSVVLALCITFIYLRYTTPTYRAAGTLLLTDNSGRSNQGGNDKFQELFVDDRTKNITNEIEFLKSRPLMERVVEALNLNFSYYAKGKIRQQNVYKETPFRLEAVAIRDSSKPQDFNILFQNSGSFALNGSSKQYRFGDVLETPTGSFRLIKTKQEAPEGEYNISWNPSNIVAKLLLPNLAVAPKQDRGGILNLSLESDNADLCADVLNQLMTEYQQATIEDKNTTTKQTLDFLDGRLKLVSHELDSITSAKLAYQTSHNLGDFETVSMSLYARGEEFFRGIGEQRQQLDKLDLIERYLRSRENAYGTVASSLGVLDVTLNTMVSSYNAAQIERKALLDALVPAGNPRVKLLEDQIEKLRGNILENIRTVRQGYNATINDLESKNGSTMAQLRSLPVMQQNLIEIQRQQESKLAVFNFLLGKREETNIALAATISNIKVLEKVSPDRVPISPKPRSAQALAILIGLIIPALFIFILEILDDKITTRADIEKITDVTILGEVGHASGNNTLVVTPKSRSFVAEQFRIIRSNLQYIVASIPKPVILITSSFSGEGKSFISTNIGAVMALAGKKTIVLEFDVRKPKILSGLNMTKKPGLSNYILGKLTKEELPVLVDGYENLYVLPCGPIPPNPSEMLLEDKMRELFVYLRQEFDVVVMDTAPVGMVGDALTLSQFADCSLYIVRQGVTHKKQIELVREFSSSNKLPKMGIVLNDIKIRAGYGYYGYGRYGYGYGSNRYGYGYGYYDADEKDAPSFMRRWFGWAFSDKKEKRKVNV